MKDKDLILPAEEYQKFLSQESQDDYLDIVLSSNQVGYNRRKKKAFDSKLFPYQSLPAASKLLFFLALAMCLKYILGAKEKLANVLL